MSKFAWWLVIWTPWFTYLAGMELPAALWKGCPWPTLSWGWWFLQGMKWIGTLVTVLFIGGMSVLMTHLAKIKNVQEGD